ncbi:MAG: alpha/beta hydrolase [Rhodovibrionaceae bacterium]
MRIEDYPPQEPLSELGREYHDECLLRGEGIEPDLEFAYGDNAYQSVSFFRAAGDSPPLFAFIHGGGWTGGYKEWMHFMAPGFTEAGISFASIGYRLAPEHCFPEGYVDAQSGAAALYNKAAELGFDRTRFFLGGHSAGGHYSALMAVNDNWQDNQGVPQDMIRGCLPISGVYDFGPRSGLSMRPRFLGPEGDGAVEESASPLARIVRTPPFLLAHGSVDFPHLMTQAERMEEALRKAGGDVERIVLEGRNHFSASYAGGEREGPWVPHALEWIGRHS